MNGPYRIYVRNSPRGREGPLMGMETDEGEARERARALSWHPLRALRPLYVAVYDAVSSDTYNTMGGEAEPYPVAVYRDGAELGDYEQVWTTPSGGAAERSEPHGTGCACEGCPDYDGDLPDPVHGGDVFARIEASWESGAA